MIWKAAVADWETNRAEVKARGGRIKDWTHENPRPKKTDPEFKQEKAIPKPTLPKEVAVPIEESDGEDFGSVTLLDDEE